jgi:hypothetical protein
MRFKADVENVGRPSSRKGVSAMAPPLVGKVEFQNSDNKAILVVDPDSSFVQLTLQSSTTPPIKIMELTNTGSLSLMGESARLDGTLRWCLLGGDGTTGALFLRNGNENVIGLDAGSGHLVLKSVEGKRRILLDGPGGNLWLGGRDQPGDLMLFDSTQADNLDHTKATVWLSGESGSLLLKNAEGKRRILLDGSAGNLWLGGRDQAGDLMLFDSTQANNLDHTKATVWLSGENGSLVLKSAAGREIVRLTAQQDGDNISIQDASGKRLFAFDNEASGNTRAGLFLGAHASQLTVDKNTGKPIDGKPGVMTLRDGAGNDSIVMDGSSGDVFLQNADCAEEFDVSESESSAGGTEGGDGSDTSGTGAVPGTVMVLDAEGRLRPSTEPYDKAVAGVVSGAGGWKPGIVLDKQPKREARVPVALMGKVYCKADADHSAISVGDLLTTSPTPGHAMKASGPVRAFGAVIGKALRPLKAGKGLVPILVALQ